MCTVSFVSSQGCKIITSNRDENIHRPPATAPVVKNITDNKIIFPQDTKAGGSWFAAKYDGSVAVLLNGGFEKHVPQPPYRKSRGLALIEFISHKEPLGYFSTTMLTGIEPFTIVYYSGEHLYELVWDGDNKHSRKLYAEGNYIWSSATLYQPADRENKRHIFKTFIAKNTNPAAGEIVGFHQSKYEDTENGFIIARGNGIKTVSITQAMINNSLLGFSYFDLLHQKEFTTETTLLQTIKSS